MSATNEITRIPFQGDAMLPVHDLAIAKTEPSDVLHMLPNGWIKDTRITFSDDSVYDSQRFQPDEQTRRFNTVATYTTPWVTDLSGFNTEQGKALMAAGMPVIAVSPEQTDVPTAIRRLADAAMNGVDLLAHDAKVQNLILDYYQETYEEAEVDEEHEVMAAGYSRGAMIGFGYIAYAAQHRRRFTYSNFVDPCVEHRPELADIRKPALLPYFTAEEPLHLLWNLAKHDFHDIRRLIFSQNISPGFLLNQIATGFSIFSGEAGSFIDHLPADTTARVELYKRSRFNQHASWQERLEPFDNIHLDMRRGVHMSGVDPKTLQRTVQHIVRAQELTHLAIEPEQLDSHRLAQAVIDYPN